ncbi:peptidoglycan-binding protein [Actinomycetes bacterium KLBMP 9797]
MSAANRRRRRRTGRVVAVTAVVVATGAAVAAASGFGLPSGNASDEPERGAAPPATAPVTRQTLVDTQTESGELGYGDTTALTGRLSGTLTGLPVAGSTVTRGQSLYKVDNAPVVLLYGGLPAYRALTAGTEGPDVTQFEKNLSALGYDGFTVDDEYTSATAAAVEEWQEDLGLTGTGTVELGRVVYASGPVRVDSHETALGGQVGPGTTVFHTTGTSRVVTVELDVADQRLAKKGTAVTVTLPDGTRVAGKIAAVTTVIQPGEGQEPDTTVIEVTVTVADAAKLAGLDAASLDVGFTAAKRDKVLTVPVAALLALAEGGYGVQVVDGATTRIVAVQTGMFAGGRVEITGDGLTEGTVVGVPA